jgi:hypothetical protein
MLLQKRSSVIIPAANMWSAEACLFPPLSDVEFPRRLNGEVVENRAVIEVEITAEQKKRAEVRHEQFQAIKAATGKDYLRNSIEEGKGEFVGFLGEEMTYDFLSSSTCIAWMRTPDDHPYDYDFQMPVSPHITVDVKTKKQGYSGMPKSHYFSTVCDKNTHQKCDLYMFARVHDSWRKGWIMGCLPKASFLSIAEWYNKGDDDPTSHCGYKFKEDCWNVAASDLWLPTSTAELAALWQMYKAPPA